MNLPYEIHVLEVALSYKKSRFILLFGLSTISQLKIQSKSVLNHWTTWSSNIILHIMYFESMAGESDCSKVQLLRPKAYLLFSLPPSLVLVLANI